ncbi:hypothetical protein RND81_06G191400 [Saponaria officinalis]|uniref:Amine oxidase domain-containing protein n=1 Tax=Saponaria officinalis TaxID=3572 RepID=A0AAW1K8K3_SAPOF
MISSTSLSLLSTPPHRHNHHHLRHHHRRQLSIFSSSTLTPSTSTTPSTAIIIGGGLAGLSAAVHLHSSGTPFLLLESSDAVGGRVRTDAVDGFLLDRGFQIFITSYPEPRKLLDYSSLNLKKFFSGARVYYNNDFFTLSNPFRHFFDSISSLVNPIGSLTDKFLVLLTTVKIISKSDDEIYLSDEVSVLDYLTNAGFSSSIIDRFFRPFFGGIFFDTDLETTSRLFEFVFKCLALGDNTLPERGIGEIPRQLAAKLPENSIRLNSRVVSVEERGGEAVVVRLENGEELRSEVGVILAVEEPEVQKLLTENLPKIVKNRKPCRSTVCLYFTTDRSKIPTSDPILYLNGSGRGIVNNMFFATNVAPSYGPPNKALVSVSLIGMYDDVTDEELTSRVVEELSVWFGKGVVREWKYLRMYRIRFAQPNQNPPTDLRKSPRVGSRLYLCGDYQTSATFDGAMVSGRRAVEALLEDKALNRVSEAVN